MKAQCFVRPKTRKTCKTQWWVPLTLMAHATKTSRSDSKSPKTSSELPLDSTTNPGGPRFLTSLRHPINFENHECCNFAKFLLRFLYNFAQYVSQMPKTSSARPKTLFQDGLKWSQDRPRNPWDLPKTIRLDALPQGLPRDPRGFPRTYQDAPKASRYLDQPADLEVGENCRAGDLKGALATEWKFGLVLGLWVRTLLLGRVVRSRLWPSIWW